MDIFKIIIITVSVFLIEDCAVNKWRDTLTQTGSTNDAINNAVKDFANTSKLCKKDSVFEVSLDSISDDIFRIVISVNDCDIYPTSKDTVGAYDPLFPTNYVVINEKLFYWNAPARTISQEILDIIE